MNENRDLQHCTQPPTPDGPDLATVLAEIERFLRRALAETGYGRVTAEVIDRHKIKVTGDVSRVFPLDKP